jgi:hypothetical protein
VGSGDWASKLWAEGDVLLSEQFKDETKYYEKAADFATAKTEIAAKVKAEDPGEKAKAAGGKAGDLSTIVNLNATWAADKSIKGKQITLTAQYLNTSTSTSNGKDFYSVVLVDSKETGDFTLFCETATKVEAAMQYGKIVVKGTIDDAFGRPSLKDCTVVEAPPPQ